MNAVWTWIIDMVQKILAAVLPLISPMLRDELEKFLVSFYKKSLETPNPWDDFLASLLLSLFQIPEPTV
jgi:hypothetical protein